MVLHCGPPYLKGKTKCMLPPFLPVTLGDKKPPRSELKTDCNLQLESSWWLNGEIVGPFASGCLQRNQNNSEFSSKLFWPSKWKHLQGLI